MGLAKKIYNYIYRLYRNITDLICYVYDYAFFDKNIQYKITKTEISKDKNIVKYILFIRPMVVKAIIQTFSLKVKWQSVVKLKLKK